MPRPPIAASRIALVVVCLLAVGPACGTSSREHRRDLEALHDDWTRDPLPEIAEDSMESALEHVTALGEDDPAAPTSLASVPLLARVALESPSSYLRLASMEAAWRLMAEVPVEAPRADELSVPEFTDRLARLQTLRAEDATRDAPETVELAETLCSQRFGLSHTDHAVSLASVAVSQALWTEPGPVREVFEARAPDLARHALMLVSIDMAQSKTPFLREGSARAARHLHPDAALPLLDALLATDADSVVLQAALESLEELEPGLRPEQLRPLLARIGPGRDVAVRQRAQALAERLEGRS